MAQFKKAQVVMLPTENKETSSIMLGVVPNHCVLTSTVLQDISDWMKFGKPQHLYVISDDEIKEGDKPCWCYNPIKNTWDKDIIYYQGAMPFYHFKGFKKIIATTDDLVYTKQNGHLGQAIIHIPQPSQQFIEKYIQAYSKGKVITEVLVEYETQVIGQCSCICHKSEFEVTHIMACCNPEYKEILKVDENNTITIKKLKNSWSREEIIELLHKFNKMGIKPISKFIEENL